MSTTEKHPRELLCSAAPGTDRTARSVRGDPGGAPRPSVLTPRDVPLGGPRAMTVRRTLPQRARSLIGPWCFVDHFGPDDVAATGGMAVPRHPHTGLATVTLLFEGQIDHIDSTGFANTVRPGEVNLMIAGRGVSHSEFSTASTTVLHGVQLWYALPDAERSGPPASQHHVAPLVDVGGAAVRTYLGQLAEGPASPIVTRTPALAVEILLPAGAHLELALDPTFEHGLLVDTGAARVGADAGAGGGAGAGGDAVVDLPADHLAHVEVGADALSIDAGPEPTRLILLGGPPFAEEIVMWWNFVGRSHEEIAAFRAQWQREIGGDDDDAAPEAAGPAASPSDIHRFGPFPERTPAPLPAPTLPNARITARRRPRRSADPHEGDPR
ncbi:pirin family protein [Brachybacterium kimchii]|uniref:Pirin family protein n=1 Tax=Brachybacterium kimchii TaxID=2942909 RepID=A0ABY4N2Q2_9MICO|nr:pirin family protein [Brachybacterium kimchii]UQN28832.1 pirin family protein [Brachybacterium kimchii]